MSDRRITTESDCGSAGRSDRTRAPPPPVVDARLGAYLWGQRPDHRAYPLVGPQAHAAQHGGEAAQGLPGQPPHRSGGRGAGPGDGRPGMSTTFTPAATPGGPATAAGPLAGGRELRCLMGPAGYGTGVGPGSRYAAGSRYRWVDRLNGHPGACAEDHWHSTPEIALVWWGLRWRDWSIGWERCTGSMALVYLWCAQAGPLEVRRWAG